MTQRPCKCCRRLYTTRKYDSAGTVIWSANYWRGFPAGGTTGPQAQVVDSEHVYVGGGRVSGGGASWSLIAFRRDTGSVVWYRDLRADVVAAGVTGYDVGTVRQVCLDPAGNVVAMLDPRSSATGQAWVTVSPAGSVVAVKSRSMFGISDSFIDFAINENGDYHLVRSLLGSTPYFTEWLSPFSAPPVVHQLGEFYAPTFTWRFMLPDGTSLGRGMPTCIRRVGGRNLFGFRVEFIAGSGSVSRLVYCVGKVQAGVPHNTVDFDTIHSDLLPRPTDFDVSDITVDGSGNVFIAGVQRSDFNADTAVRKYSSSGVLLWQVNCAGRGIDVDSDGNLYASANQVPTVQKRNSSGILQWGHGHAYGRLVDVSGDDRFFSGGGLTVGPKNRHDDVAFVSDPCPPTVYAEPCEGACSYVPTNPTTSVVQHDTPTSGTFTWPTNCALTVEIWGSGAGGAAGVFGGNPGQGGGSGGYRKIGPMPFTPSMFLHWVIGDPGLGAIAGAPDPSGADGGDTSISGSEGMIAYGGKGGFGTGGRATDGAAGGGLGGTVSLLGSPGQLPSGPNGGNGGNGPTGALGGPGGHSDNGGNGAAPGAGGGGGSRGDNGGNGGNGRVKFTITTWDWLLDDDGCTAECDGCQTVDADFYLEHERPTSSGDVIEVDCE
ncbi:hypothetical protein [Schlesneria sp.]|uniref:glycine-rich domain-containing protein n=1 Tax=Schlesneria sp. TaxID=2762018 RepID=UPI002F16FB9A